MHIHAKLGTPQLSADKLRALQDYLGEGAEPDILGKVFETFGERRPLWQFMWGGAFDRFPRLKIVFVEVHCDWVPPTLAYLDDYARSARRHHCGCRPRSTGSGTALSAHRSCGTATSRYDTRSASRK